MKQHSEQSFAHRQYNLLIRSPCQSPTKTQSPRRADEHRPNRTTQLTKKTSFDSDMPSDNMSISIQPIGRSRVLETSDPRYTFQLKSPPQLDTISSSSMSGSIPLHVRNSPRAKCTALESIITKSRSGVSPRQAFVSSISPKANHSVKLRGHISTQSDLDFNKYSKQQSSIIDVAQTTQECTERSYTAQSDFQSFNLGLLKDIVSPSKQHESSSTHSFFRKKHANDRSPNSTGLEKMHNITVESQEVKPQLQVMQQYKEFIKNSQMKKFIDLRQTCLNKNSRKECIHQETQQMEQQRRKNSVDLALLAHGSHGNSNIPSCETTNLKDFSFGKCIGNGKFGEVYLARHKHTGLLVAIKKICKFTIKQYKMQKQMAEQIKLQSYCNNSNIVHLYGFFHDELHIYLILEYATDGTLFTHLHKHNSKLFERDVAFILKEVIYAVQFLHQNDIAHRDIKPQNILLSSGVAKLCDFGWSARVLQTRKSYCGTFDYTPPEILQRKSYDESVDLWCLGVLAYELMTGQVPFSNKDRKAAMSKIINVDKERISYPCDISPTAQSLIEGLLRKNPKERLRPGQLLQHSFFKIVRKEK